MKNKNDASVIKVLTEEIRKSQNVLDALKQNFAAELAVNPSNAIESYSRRVVELQATIRCLCHAKRGVEDGGSLQTAIKEFERHVWGYQGGRSTCGYRNAVKQDDIAGHKEAVEWLKKLSSL
jgi:hypothetical protein